jgi:hypothetical protein
MFADIFDLSESALAISVLSSVMTDSIEAREVVEPVISDRMDSICASASRILRSLPSTTYLLERQRVSTRVSQYERAAIDLDVSEIRDEGTDHSARFVYSECSAESPTHAWHARCFDSTSLRLDWYNPTCKPASFSAFALSVRDLFSSSFFSLHGASAACAAASSSYRRISDAIGGRGKSTTWLWPRKTSDPP